MAIKWRITNPSGPISDPDQKIESVANVGRPPAQGVFGNSGLFGCHRAHAAGTGPSQFRSPRRRLSEFANRLGRSDGMCTRLRARPALPFMELRLSDRNRRQRDVLAE